MREVSHGTELAVTLGAQPVAEALRRLADEAMQDGGRPRDLAVLHLNGACKRVARYEPPTHAIPRPALRSACNGSSVGRGTARALGFLVELRLAGQARPRVGMVVRAALALRLLSLAPGVNERVVSRAEDSDTVFTWKLRATLSDRLDVMNVQRPPATACEVRESALGVNREDARTVFAPGL